MADAKSSRKAKTFISLLASRFKEDKHDIDSQELLSYFTDAVANLPKSKVKTALQKEFDIHFKHLSSILNVVPTTQKQYKGVTRKTSGLNLFAGGGLEKALKTYRQCKTDEEKYDIYKSLQACYPYLNNTNEIFSTLKQDAEGDDLSAVKKCTEITIGCCTKRSVLECLSFILGEFSSKYEKLINQQESDGRNERFLEEALQSIVLMNHRWKTSSSDEKDLTPAHSYEDLMAAMLSLYTDVQLISSSRSEKTNISTENLATLIFAVLGHSPEHCMDVLLQVTQLDDSSGEALLSLLRCILERNQGTLKTTQYIKFICLARIGLRTCSSVSSSVETKTSVHKVAERQAAPARFVSLLSKHNKRLVERLALTKKMTANRVTAHLLGEQREEDIEALLDLASESRPEREQEPQEDQGLSPKGETQGDLNQDADQPDQPLFFIDSAGGHNDDDETQKVEFEEIEVEDAILHRQLKSIIGQLQEPSDSEDEELEFAVDDDNVDMFVIDKTPSETTNQNSQHNVTVKEDEETTAESNNNQESLDSSPPSPQKRTRGMDGHEDKKDVEEVISNGQDSGKGNKDGSSKVKRKSIKSETPGRTATRSSSRRTKKKPE